MKTLKTIVVGILLVVIMGLAATYLPVDTAEVIQNKSATEAELKEEPEMPSEWQNEAQEAYEAVIRRKTLEQEKERLESIVASTTDRIDTIDKELGLY